MSSLISISITKIDLKLSTKFHSMLVQTRTQREETKFNEKWDVTCGFPSSCVSFRWFEYENNLVILAMISQFIRTCSHHVEWEWRNLKSDDSSSFRMESSFARILLLPKCNREMTKFLFFCFKRRKLFSSWTFSQNWSIKVFLKWIFLSFTIIPNVITQWISTVWAQRPSSQER